MAIVKQAKDWKGEKFGGSVLFTKMNSDCSAGYGFIAPDGATDRSDNVWFGASALQGASIEKGDLVEFVLMREQRGAGLAAFRVWIMQPATRGNDSRDEVETIYGEDD